MIMAGMRLDPADAFALMGMFLVTGGLLNAVQTTMYALAANVYPTEIRSTGVGTAVAFGRIGNVLAVYVGNYALDPGRAAGLFHVVGDSDGPRLRVAGRHPASRAADVEPWRRRLGGRAGVALSFRRGGPSGPRAVEAGLQTRLICRGVTSR